MKQPWGEMTVNFPVTSLNFKILDNSQIITIILLCFIVAFKIYDLDKDGKISKDDLLGVCEVYKSFC